MNRATWPQDRRMQKFRDVLSRWEAGKLSMMEAGELLGVSERPFPRYRDRNEEAGLKGLVDGRLGKRSARRVPERHLKQMLRLYCEVYRGSKRRWLKPHSAAPTLPQIRSAAVRLRPQATSSCVIGGDQRGSPNRVQLHRAWNWEPISTTGS